MRILKPEVKAAWVAALRSGEFKQGRGALRNSEDEFCCLGVLCELAAREGVTRLDEPNSGESHRFYEGTLAYPPDSVSWWAKQEATGNAWQGRLASINDAGGKSFTEIADIIEKEL